MLQARAERVALVHDCLATGTPDELTGKRRNPWFPDREVTVLSCLRTVLNEEWEHLRFATCDLDVCLQ